jgi:hypothetical protein
MLFSITTINECRLSYFFTLTIIKDDSSPPGCVDWEVDGMDKNHYCWNVSLQLYNFCIKKVLHYL